MLDISIELFQVCIFNNKIKIIKKNCVKNKLEKL